MCIVHHTMGVSVEVRREHGSPGTEATDSCEPPGVLGLHPGSKQEQPALSGTELQLQPQKDKGLLGLMGVSTHAHPIRYNTLTLEQLHSPRYFLQFPTTGRGRPKSKNQLVGQFQNMNYSLLQDT